MMPKSALRISGLLLAGIAIGYLLGTAVPVSKAISKISRSPDTSPLRTPVSEGARPADRSIPSTPVVTTRAGVEEMMNGLKDIPSMDERARKFSAAIGEWAQSDGKAALAFARELPDDAGYLKMEAIAAVARVLAAQDPKYLAKVAASLPQDATRQLLIQALVQQGAETDLAQTLAWAETLPPDRSRNEALRVLRARLARENPEEAAQTLARMPQGYQRQNLAGVIATEWGLRDPRAAAQWASGLTAAEKEAAIPALAASWAQSNPQDVGNFIAGLPPGEMQNRAAMSVVANWATQNPETAAAWVVSFPGDGLREMGVREVANAWSRIDPDAALKWAAQLSEEKARDVALTGYVETFGYWAPDRAVAAVKLIKDQAQQERSIESALRSWSEVDPDAARSWLLQQDFRLGLKNRLSEALSLQ